MTALTRSTALRTTLRERKCVICAERFKQAQPMQAVCGVRCAIVHGKKATAKQEAAKARAERIATKTALEKFKTKGEWTDEVQRVFNAYIRERDKDKPCICCGKFFDEKDTLTGGQWDAGHYISRGHAAHLRFVEDNVHKQLKGHNRPGGTTRAAFRAGMIERIGQNRVELLEADNTPRHYTIDDLKAMKAEYAAKLRALKEQA
jgi:hypothetical protein